MNIQFQFGKIRISYEGDLEGFPNKDIQLEGIASKPNLELFNKMYKKVPENMMNYFKDANKMLMGYANTKRTKKENAVNTPNTMLANGHDIYNYVARYGLADFQIQSIMKFDGYLDFTKLSKAVRLSVVEQPIFGCRFIESEPPYWRRLKNIDETVFCFFEETNNPDKVVQKFLESPLDMDEDPMLRIKLVRSGTYDTLCIKINHACCDGIGTIEYIRLLSKIYSTIDQENGVFIPNPSKRSRKDQDRLFSELGISDPESEWIPGSENTKATWPFPWTQVQSDNTKIIIKGLSNEQLNRMKRYSKLVGATINDLILTAYYRAMPEMGEPIYGEPMGIPVTFDLRRYLPDHKTEAIRNFSGSEITSIDLVPNESFGETLARVIPMMNKIKNSRPALQSAIGLERVEKLTFKETLDYYKTVALWPYYCGDKCAPVLSNLGIIADTLLKFGETAVTSAYIVPPVVRSPGFLLMVSTYNGIITLAGGFYEGTVNGEYIQRLFDKINDELVEGCR